jgi:hypothetical protein
MVHICNPSYSEGRDQEDSGSKSAWANSSRDPILEKPITKNRTGGAAQGEDPEFKPQHWEKKKKDGGSQYVAQSCYLPASASLMLGL